MKLPPDSSEHNDGTCYKDRTFVEAFMERVGTQATYFMSAHEGYDTEEVQRLTGLEIDQVADLCHAFFHLFKDALNELITSTGSVEEFKKSGDEELEGTMVVLLLLGAQLGRRELVNLAPKPPE